MSHNFFLAAFGVVPATIVVLLVGAIVASLLVLRVRRTLTELAERQRDREERREEREERRAERHARKAHGVDRTSALEAWRASLDDEYAEIPY